MEKNKKRNGIDNLQLRLNKVHFLYNRSQNLEKTEENEYETCVLCGKKTTVKQTTHVDLRDYFVNGCGQLCPECWKETFLKKPIKTWY